MNVNQMNNPPLLDKTGWSRKRGIGAVADTQRARVAETVARQEPNHTQ